MSKTISFVMNIRTIKKRYPFRVPFLYACAWHFRAHGPITPYLPSTMLQTKKTQVYISEELAAPFECWEKVGY